MSVLKLLAAVILDYTNLTTAFLAVFVFLLIYKMFRRPRNLPPGPRPWPLFGNLFILSRDKAHLQFTEWTNQYGNVFMIYYGPKPVVVLNGYDTIQEALINKAEDFTDRPGMNNSLGIAFAPYGPFWKEQRKFTMAGLRDFGFGKRSLEGKILEEADALGREIVKTEGKPFNILSLLRKAVTNVVCSIVFGARHEYEDPAFKTFLQHVDTQFRTSIVIGQLARFLRHLPVLGRSARTLLQAKEAMRQFIKLKVDEHQQDFEPDDIRDFVDLYIQEMRRGQMRRGQRKNFTDQQLVYIVVDLIIAGTDTTAQSLYWILLYMILYPELQEKAQEEIYRTFGDSAPPTTAKRQEVPFTEAVVWEVQRINSVAPLTIPRCTSNDTVMYGYDIPRGTMVHVNLWSVLRDPGLWEEPDQFKPERFLDNQGQCVKKDAFIPFSIGRRYCLGTQLAKMELFMFTTYLLQHFTFKLPEGDPTPSTVGKLGISNGARPYELCAIPK
ncbi:PREDICTED: cytochrome P450 2U1-like [Branchiostoma belcheri]|uniref:Cytochrome P450 2U1 n=1 Tax=Branchiostoma belcheri TaxID=7741 RepID=A0A6P4Z4B8_BRABE|nr:PREDICTED: cytochrome P450 2U1-like [Branchiostoma belcheri]